MARIYLSPPDMGPDERALLLEAFDSNWIAPLGPHVDQFERELAEYVGVSHAVALASGTSALHLALVVLGIGPGDEVIVPTLTFVAAANAVRYVGACPVFVDSERTTWNIDSSLIVETVAERRKAGHRVRAVIAVDLYGQCADYGRIREHCEEEGLALIEDAAEALGATYGSRAAGALGDIGVFSFNGNKIITTSGGGMLVTDRAEWANGARYLSMQAREPALHYEHAEIGFNYRMSNLLAAVGRGQLRHLREKVARRRAINDRYRSALAGLPGIEFHPRASFGDPSCWLTVLTVDPALFGASRDDVIDALAEHDIEARPVWKPMHLQPLYKSSPRTGGDVAEDLFERGVCLPSGSSLGDADIDKIIELMTSIRRG